jgi:sulfoxide reductase heme-binding subunit YedZ
MSVGYQPVLWNKYKKQYDAVLWGSILAYLVLFIGYNAWAFPSQNLTNTLIRALGTLAILMLHFILMIGPACRIWSALLPLLYNRRHLGVTMFLVAAGHSVLSLYWFHGNGDTHPLLSVFTANTHYDSLRFFPFQPLGLIALLILAIMAFTSHDFWLSFLGPKIWKSLHMLVYIAYALVILHVVLGVIQFEKSPVLVSALLLGLVLVTGLHLLAGRSENQRDNRQEEMLGEEWVYAGLVGSIPENRARTVLVNQERVAIFRYDGKLSAVHNVCKHQMGPLGEGKVVDGCITCPWHGYQYRPEDGCAPPPFQEKVHTYALKMVENKVYVSTIALPEGTYVEPLQISAQFLTSIAKKAERPFFIGWNPSNPAGVLSLSRYAAFAFSGLALGMGLLLSSQQQRLSHYQIDYVMDISLEGWLSLKPFPMLTVVDGRDGNGNPSLKSILLVEGFKHGAIATVKQLLQETPVQYVKMTGYISHHISVCGNHDNAENGKDSCIHCLHGTQLFPLVELSNGLFSFKPAQEPFPFKGFETASSRDTTLQGELIDPKCHFGAMNPGQGKPHRSCAVRCISGGIMPAISYGNGAYTLLLGSKGEAINAQVLPLVGEPLKVKGRLSRLHNWNLLYLDPSKDIERLLR